MFSAAIEVRVVSHFGYLHLERLHPEYLNVVF